MKTVKRKVNSKKSAIEVGQLIVNLQEEFKDLDVSVDSATGKYSQKQRGALHVWCEQCAQVLSDQGFPCYFPSLGLTNKLMLGQFPITIEQDDLIEGEWTMISFKELQYKRTLAILTGKLSTEDQSSIDPSDVARVMQRGFGANGIPLPDWPSLR